MPTQQLELIPRETVLPSYFPTALRRTLWSHVKYERGIRPDSLYFALLPDRETTERFTELGWRAHEATGVRGFWVPHQQLHLTLLGFGVPLVDGVPALHIAIEAAKRIRQSAFELEVNRIGTFTSGKRRFGVLRFQNDRQALLDELRFQLNEQLKQVGLPTSGKRTFTPHVTLVRDSDRLFPEAPLAAPIPWQVDRMVLVRSIFEPKFRQEHVASIPVCG